MAQVEYKVGDKIDLSNLLVKISSAQHPEYNIGDKFVMVSSDDSRRNGQVVELSSNDNSSNPYFNTTWGSDYIISWNRLAKLPEGKAAKASKPSVTSTMTIYSDGVEVNEEQVRFDGKTMTRGDAKKTVARYQEVLRRPIAVVPSVTKAVVKKTTKVTKKATKK